MTKILGISQRAGTQHGKQEAATPAMFVSLKIVFDACFYWKEIQSSLLEEKKETYFESLE